MAISCPDRVVTAPKLGVEIGVKIRLAGEYLEDCLIFSIRYVAIIAGQMSRANFFEPCPQISPDRRILRLAE
jgi:hypothetical protein